MGSPPGADGGTSPNCSEIVVAQAAMPLLQLCACVWLLRVLLTLHCTPAINPPPGSRRPQRLLPRSGADGGGHRLSTVGVGSAADLCGTSLVRRMGAGSQLCRCRFHKALQLSCQVPCGSAQEGACKVKESKDHLPARWQRRCIEEHVKHSAQEDRKIRN